MKIYFSPGACSMAVHITARVAGLDVEPIKVDLRAHKLEDGRDFYAVNPKGYVPAIELADGSVLTENVAVLQFVADQAPGSGLAPAAGTADRYRFVEWLGFINSEIHKGFGPLWNPASAPEAKQAAKDKLATRFAFVEKQLAGRHYLMGSQFTAADAYLFTVLNWSGIHAVDLQPYANIGAYMGRIAALPKVQDTMAAEGLLKAAA